MFARVTIGQAAPERLDEGTRLIQTNVTQMREPGFAGGLLLVDPQTGNTLVLSLWATEADLRASTAGQAARVDSGVAAGIWQQRPTVAVYEVAAKFEPARW
jgi:hypothetical protein